MVAEWRPNTPLRLGPCAPPLSPLSALWHSAHCWRKTVLPAFASAANVGAAHMSAASAMVADRIIILSPQHVVEEGASSSGERILALRKMIARSTRRSRAAAAVGND